VPLHGPSTLLPQRPPFATFPHEHLSARPGLTLAARFARLLGEAR